MNENYFIFSRELGVGRLDPSVFIAFHYVCSVKVKKVSSIRMPL